VLMAISSSMKMVVKIFAYVKYGLGFNYTTVVNDTHIVQHASCASNLVQDNAFIYGTLHVSVLHRVGFLSDVSCVSLGQWK
jgi:hypothetical protein